MTLREILDNCEVIEYAGVKPLDFDGFEREAKISSLRKI